MTTLRHALSFITILNITFSGAYCYTKTKHHPKTFNPHQVRHIIWDAGSTLIQVSQLAIVRELGMKHVVSMFFNFRKPSRMRQYMFEALEQYGGKQQPSNPNGLYTCDDHNTPLPHFMSDTWLCSRISNKEILKAINMAVEQWHPRENEVSSKQRKLLKKTLRVALCARILGKNTICSPRASRLVAQLADLGYKQYILSNFEKEAFDITYTNIKNRTLFEYIPQKNIVISGDCKMIKPHPSIYQYFLEKYRLNAEECLLIDDRPENVKAALECGMQAILIKNCNYKKLSKKIKKLLDE